MRPRADTRLVWTGGACSYGCGHCPYATAPVPDGVSAAALLQALAGGGSLAGQLALLVGGEPLLHPELPRLAAALRAADAEVGLVTTGRPLLYPRLRRMLRRVPLRYLRIQLFGIDAGHDRASGVPGSFAQALQAVDAWCTEADASAAVDVALATRGRPLATLAAELDGLAARIPAAAQLVVAVDARARAALASGDPEALAALAALRDWNAGGTRPLLAWEGLPPQAAALVDLGIAPPPPQFIGPAPAACCLGTLEDLAVPAPYDDTQVRANSFNFVRTETTVPWTPDAASCGAHTAAAGRPPASHLWLVDGAQLTLHSTDTADFPPAAVAEIKDELSHVFVDRAAPGVLDDFIEGMRRVLSDPVCASCAHHATCGHRFTQRDGPPFAAEEAWIAAHLSALHGRVLDVGCGEQLYRDVLAPRLRAGALRYHGLDPDALSLARVREAMPEGRYTLGGIETFRGPPAHYDHILCLRALNHVLDMDEAIGRMAALLAPGGCLLLVETTPFALLRRPEQVAAADRAPRAGHQHYRNVRSTDVLPFARRHGLAVRHHHPIGRDATNQWVLLLERPAGA